MITAIKYLKEEYGKNSIIMSARGHVGREVIDALSEGVIERILFAEDFEYRLNMNR